MLNAVFVLCFVSVFEVSKCGSTDVSRLANVTANGQHIALYQNGSEYSGQYNFTTGKILQLHCRGLYTWSITLSGFSDISTTPKAVDNYLILTMEDDYNGKYLECKGGPYNGATILIKIVLVKVGDAPANSTNDGANISYGQVIDQYIQLGYPQIKNITTTKIFALFLREFDRGKRKIQSISYSYDRGEDLYLSCIGENLNDTLYFETKSVSCVEQTPPKLYKCMLLPNGKTGKIWCESKVQSSGKVTELQLVVRDKVTSTSRPDESTANTPDTALGNNYIKGTQEITQTRGIGLKLWITIAACSLLFLFVFIFITMQVCKSKPKPRKLQSDSQVSYKNMQHQNHNQDETTSAPPSNQWQEAQYSAPTDRVQGNEDYATPFNPNLAEMYATPIPKSKRLLKTTNKKEDETTYANDNAGYTPEVTYANNMPKHASDDNLTKESKRPRKGVAVMPDVTYSEIQHTNPKQRLGKTHDYSNVPGNSYNPYEDTKNESEYVDVAENSYKKPGNMHAKGYVNVFKGQKYVNSSEKSDYAEPAYYEVQK